MRSWAATSRVADMVADQATSSASSPAHYSVEATRATAAVADTAAVDMAAAETSWVSWQARYLVVESRATARLDNTAAVQATARLAVVLVDCSEASWEADRCVLHPSRSI